MSVRKPQIVLLAFCLSLNVYAPVWAIEAEDKLGNWIGATGTLRYSDKWSLFLQGELRTWEMVNNLNELLWRVGGHYDFNSKNMGAFGYVRVDTWPFESGGLRKFYENRLYEEFLMKRKWGQREGQPSVPAGAALDYDAGNRDCILQPRALHASIHQTAEQRHDQSRHMVYKGA